MTTRVKVRCPDTGTEWVITDPSSMTVDFDMEAVAYPCQSCIAVHVTDVPRMIIAELRLAGARTA